MDTFFEQLVVIKKNAKTYIIYALMLLLSVILMGVCYLMLTQFFILIAAIIIWGDYKLYSLTNVEYEYIITNSAMDIDKIISKSSRKRVFSFELGTVERCEKYRDNLPQDILKDCIYACNKNDDNAYLFVIHPEGKAKQSLVISPDERMSGAMKKFMPKYVSDNLK